MREADLERCIFSLPHGFRVLVAGDSILAPCVPGNPSNLRDSSTSWELQTMV